ncbi:unnamed protein product [Prorocentrum cordatum]|uniref:Uncharacterized protein n=1 Tax=Prorocentrum cordatum TaxID=2364126 RepID=A0ABN9QN82_9DINO|nr:unnamed protein product [Polarella glacialis]
MSLARITASRIPNQCEDVERAHVAELLQQLGENSKAIEHCRVVEIILSSQGRLRQGPFPWGLDCERLQIGVLEDCCAKWAEGNHRWGYDEVKTVDQSGPSSLQQAHDSSKQQRPQVRDAQQEHSGVEAARQSAADALQLLPSPPPGTPAGPTAPSPSGDFASAIQRSQRRRGGGWGCCREQ